MVCREIHFRAEGVKDVSIPLRSLLIYTPALPKQALAAYANSKGLERPHLNSPVVLLGYRLRELDSAK